MAATRSRYYSLAAAAMFVFSSLAAGWAGRWGALGTLLVVATAGSACAALWLGQSHPGLLSALPRPVELALPESGESGGPVREPAPLPSRLRKDAARVLATPGFYWRLAVLCVCYGFAGFISFGLSTMNSPRGAPLTPLMTAYLVAMFGYWVGAVIIAAAGVGVRLGASLPAPVE